MSIIRVFNGNLVGDSYSLTDEIGNATGFYIVAPDESVDVQVDVFLQLEISSLDNRQIRLFEGITENDTRTILLIPEEFTFTNTIKRFALYSEFSVYLELWCIYKDNSIDSEQLDLIEAKIDNLQTTSNINTALSGGIAVNQLQQNVALGLLGASLAPITIGASLSIEPPLLSGTTALSSTLLLLP